MAETATEVCTCPLCIKDQIRKDHGNAFIACGPALNTDRYQPSGWADDWLIKQGWLKTGCGRLLYREG